MKQTTAFITLLGLFHFSYAQQTRVITDPQATFKQAKEFYQREQYSLAYPLLKDLQLQQTSADRSSQATIQFGISIIKRPAITTNICRP